MRCPPALLVLLVAGALWNGPLQSARAQIADVSAIEMTMTPAPPPAPPANFTLIPLPYSEGALEPNIDNLTMGLHYGRHYRTAITNVNTATAPAEYSALRLKGITGLVLAVGTGELPTPIARVIRNNAGGAWNHALFWKTMAPPGSMATMDSAMSPALSAAIKTSFGNVTAMRAQLQTAAMGVFGSGWGWVVYTGNSSAPLAISTTPNQDNPLMGSLNGTIANAGTVPILGVDVWEHAYYKKYGPARVDYLTAWQGVVNWQQVSKNLDYAKAKAYSMIGQ